MAQNDFYNRYLKIRWNKDYSVHEQMLLALIDDIKKTEQFTAFEYLLLGKCYDWLFFITHMDHYNYAEESIKNYMSYYKTGLFEPDDIVSLVNIMEFAYQYYELYALLKEIGEIDEWWHAFSEIQIGKVAKSLLYEGVITQEECEYYKEVLRTRGEYYW